MPEATNDVLEVQLRTLNQNVAHVMTAIDEMRDELKKIGVLEVNHSHQEAATKRAFDQIEKVEKAHLDRVAKDNEAHAKYDRTIAFAAGVVLAVSAFWTVFGVRMNNAIDEVVRTSLEMRIHMSEDKVKGAEDVHRAMRSGPQP